MKLTSTIFMILLSCAIVSSTQIAKAEDQSEQREQVKKELLLPECSWSKMQKAEYDECQKKRSTLKAMTPEERAKYLNATEPGLVGVDDSGHELRNRAIINRANGGGRKGR